MTDTSCPTIPDLNGDIDVVKTNLLELDPSCRGNAIYVHVLGLVTDVLSHFAHLSLHSRDKESMKSLIADMDKITSLLRDPEIAELLRSATYGKYHSGKIKTDVYKLKNDVRVTSNIISGTEDDYDEDLKNIDVTNLMDDPGAPLPRAP